MSDANQQAAPQPINSALSAGQAAPAPTPQQLPPGVRLINVGELLQNFEQRIKALEAAGEAKGKAFVQKYWPLGVGLLLAASRFVHF